VKIATHQTNVGAYDESVGAGAQSVAASRQLSSAGAQFVVTHHAFVAACSPNVALDRRNISAERARVVAGSRCVAAHSRWIVVAQAQWWCRLTLYRRLPSRDRSRLPERCCLYSTRRCLSIKCRFRWHGRCWWSTISLWALSAGCRRQRKSCRRSDKDCCLSLTFDRPSRRHRRRVRIEAVWAQSSSL